MSVRSESRASGSRPAPPKIAPVRSARDATLAHLSGSSAIIVSIYPRFMGCLGELARRRRVESNDRGSHPMRRHPRIPTLIASLAASAALALPSVASADVSIESQGRFTRTGPKQPQSEFNGRPLEGAPVERPSGRTLTARGRRLHAQPTQRVSVGIIGCPGCTEALEAAGGIVVDGRGARFRTRRDRRR